MYLKDYKHITELTVGWIAQSVQQLAMGGMVWRSSSSGREIFHTCPDRPWGPPNLLYNGYQIIFGVKWPEHGFNHPPPSSAEAKGRVELYLYSPTVPSLLVIGEAPFTFLMR